MNWLIQSMLFFILIFITSALVGLIFCPENVGKAHKTMYDGYLRGWYSK